MSSAVSSCLVYLVSLMVDLEEEIGVMKEKIAEYELEHRNATSEEKKELRAIIIESRKTLNALLQQQPQGE